MEQRSKQPDWLSSKSWDDYYTVPVAGKAIARMVADRAQAAVRLMSDCIDVHPDKRGAVPVLAGTRFTLSQLLAELAEGDRSIDQVAEDFDLDAATVRTFLEGLSIYLDRPALP